MQTGGKPLLAVNQFQLVDSRSVEASKTNRCFQADECLEFSSRVMFIEQLSQLFFLPRITSLISRHYILFAFSAVKTCVMVKDFGVMNISWSPTLR